MRIMFLTQVLPYPLDAGAKTRAYYVIRHLVESGHEVTLVSFTRATDRPEHLRHLRNLCRSLYTTPMVRSRFRDARAFLRSLGGRKPFLAVRDWVPAMARLVRHVAAGSADPDAIHADQLWMAPYALLARSFVRQNRAVPVVLDQHNAVFQVPRRLAEAETVLLRRAALNLEARKLAQYEARVCSEVDRVVWVTEEDRQSLGSHNPQLKANGACRVIPICIDTDSAQVIERKVNPHRITFLGGLHWPPNADGIAWFTREVWPAVAAQFPAAVLTVIGKDPPACLLSQRNASIEITGYVEDPVRYLSETAVLVIPLRAGGGMRVKLIEAWSWGLPVVSTRLGAEGIRAEDGANILFADDPRSFADAVLKVCNDPALAARLVSSGLRTVRERYDWRRGYRAWNDIYPCVSS